ARLRPARAGRSGGCLDDDDGCDRWRGLRVAIGVTVVVLARAPHRAPEAARDRPAGAGAAPPPLSSQTWRRRTTREGTGPCGVPHRASPRHRRARRIERCADECSISICVSPGWVTTRAWTLRLYYKWWTRNSPGAARRPGCPCRVYEGSDRAILDRPIVDVIELVAGVTQLLADVVTGVADLVGEILAVALAPGFLRGLFGLAGTTLDVVHVAEPPCAEPPRGVRAHG